SIPVHFYMKVFTIDPVLHCMLVIVATTIGQVEIRYKIKKKSIIPQLPSLLIIKQSRRDIKLS
ncbi:hypothetical protein L9F63_003507, partial [Diploptera punctata]